MDFRPLERELLGDLWTSDTAWDNLAYLCDECHGRLAGTADERRARDFLLGRLNAYGLDHVAAEPFEMRGWERGEARLSLEAGGLAVGLPCHALPGSPGCDVRAEVLDAGRAAAADYARLGGAARGKIVFNSVDGVGRAEMYRAACEAGAVLAATTAGQTTFYVHGPRGPLAELTASWGFYLPDGQGTARQLADASGSITLVRRYTPWGEILQQAGTGNFAWGYFGGLMDAATGLIYVGGGQYFDPATGRFLTRAVAPGAPNPYVPWRADPLGAALGPVGLLIFMRRRRGQSDKADRLFLLVLVLVGGALLLTACTEPTQERAKDTQTAPPSTPTPSRSRTPAPTPSPSRTQPPTPRATRTPQPTATLPRCPEPTSTPTSTPTPSAVINFVGLPQFGRADQIVGAGCKDDPCRAAKALAVLNYMRSHPGNWWGSDPKQVPAKVAAWIVSREAAPDPDARTYYAELTHWWYIYWKAYEADDGGFVTWLSMHTAFFDPASDGADTFSWNDLARLQTYDTVVEQYVRFDWSSRGQGTAYRELRFVYDYVQESDVVAGRTWGYVDVDKGTIDRAVWNEFYADALRSNQESCLWAAVYPDYFGRPVFFGTRAQFEWAFATKTTQPPTWPTTCQ
jgi:RHS repeat-associated protein